MNFWQDYMKEKSGIRGRISFSLIRKHEGVNTTYWLQIDLELPQIIKHDLIAAFKGSYPGIFKSMHDLVLQGELR